MVLVFCVLFFFFKQKTAYEMRISDWSSDVCSSDLSVIFGQEDQFTNRLAQTMSLPVVPVLGANTKLQPVYAADVGKAIAIAARDSARNGGNVYDTGGPAAMPTADIHNWIDKPTKRLPRISNLPDSPTGTPVSSNHRLPSAP